MDTEIIDTPGWSRVEEGMAQGDLLALKGLWAYLYRNGGDGLAVGVQFVGTDTAYRVDHVAQPPADVLSAIPDAPSREVLRTLLYDLDDHREALEPQPEPEPAVADVAEPVLPEPDPEPEDVAYAEASAVMLPLQVAMSAYTHLFDLDAIIAGLAVGVAQAIPGDPLWLMLVHASSGGKSEVVRLLDGVADERLKDATLPGLISMTQAKQPRPIGLLMGYVGADALFTISDLSSMLGDTRQSSAQKTELWNALRDIYDGEYSRVMHGGAVAWNGRLTMLSACTPEIDRFTAYANALGTRWLQYRPPETDVPERIERADYVLRRSEINEKRRHAQAIATDLITAARERIPAALPESFYEPLAWVADLAAYGRATIPRGWNREVDGVQSIEEPMRLAGQLQMLALACLALGVGEAMALRVTHRAALSSMPQDRRRVLMVLAGTEEPLSGRAVARAADLHHAVASRALEDWALLGFVETERTNDDGDPIPGSGWRLTAEKRDGVRAAAGHAADIPHPLISSSGVRNVRHVSSPEVVEP
jgi:hypothetical protein